MSMQHDNVERLVSKRTVRNTIRELGALGLRELMKIGRGVIILVLIVLSYPVLEFVIEYGRTHSDAYHVATQFALNNPVVSRVTGPVLKIQIDNRFNFHFCSRQADYTMNLTGENADATLQIQVQYLGESWVVTEAVLHTADHNNHSIKQTTTDWRTEATSTWRESPFLWNNACYGTSFPPMFSGTFG